MTHLAWKAFATSAPHNPNLLDFKKFTEFNNNLLNKVPFHVSRFNDGEWVFMLQTEPYYSHYIQRSRYPIQEVKDISTKMLSIIDSKPPYYIGIDSTTLAGVGSIKTDYEVFQKKIMGLNVVYGEIFNAATVMYGLDALRRPLKDRWVLTVGPEYMQYLHLGHQHIVVPSKSCWNAASSIEKQVEDALSAQLEKHPVVLYSCSLLAKWLVDVMYNKFENSITQLDIGSCIDPWCGVSSRPWHPALSEHYGLNIPTPKAYTPPVNLPASVSTGYPAPSGGGRYGNSRGYGYGYSKKPARKKVITNKAYSRARDDRAGSVINEAIFAWAHASKRGLNYLGTCGYNPGTKNHFEDNYRLSKLLNLPLPAKDFPTPYLDYREITSSEYSPAIYSDVNRLLDSKFIEMLRVRYLETNPPLAQNPFAAIHIRRGDVKSDNQMRYSPNAYYMRIIQKLLERRPNLELRIFSESDSSESFQEFIDLECKLFLDHDLVDTWRQMICSDVLVMSKSSFAYVPAIYNSKLVIYQPAWYAKLNHWQHVDDFLSHTL